MKKAVLLLLTAFMLLALCACEAEKEKPANDQVEETPTVVEAQETTPKQDIIPEENSGEKVTIFDPTTGTSFDVERFIPVDGIQKLEIDPNVRIGEEKSEAIAIVGGWNIPDDNDKVVTEEILGYFNDAAAGTAFEGYTPLEVLGTQVVAGINYRLLCTAPDGVETEIVLSHSVSGENTLVPQE